MNTGLAIKIAMVKSGVNQKELSKLSGVNETTISHTVSGKSSPNAKTLSKLADAMNISYSELIKLGE